MDHIFFIRSSFNGYLDCFHVLAIVNSAAVNTEVYVSFQIMFFSGCMPRSQTAELYSSSIFSFFMEPPYCSPQWLYQFTYLEPSLLDWKAHIVHLWWGWWFSRQVVSDSCNPMDCSLPGSTIHGILQASILEWVAISFSRGIFPIQDSNPGLLHYRQILYYPPNTQDAKLTVCTS